MLSAISASRREFLAGVGRALLGAASAGWCEAWAADSSQAAPASKRGMIVRSLRYLDLETPVEYFASWITPVEHFFVRNHVSWPTALEVSEWRLQIAGEVERPLRLSYRELRRLPAASVVSVLECAGNGRAFYQPQVPGIQWERGAVGNARFAGVPLRDLLLRAGVKPAGRHVMFRGLDEPPGKVPPFVRSIPLAKALDLDTIIATHMNGAPLTKFHGFPARSLVPGWVGAASVKWLGEIRVLAEEYDGHFMKSGYRLPSRPLAPGEAPGPGNTIAVTALPVKSVIASPADGSRHRKGPVQITGAAWAGESEVVRVEVSADEGKTWQQAPLNPSQEKHAWRLWSLTWKPNAPGAYVLMARATDRQGRTQPLAPSWNPSGYLWNAADRTRIHVEG